MEEIKLSKTKLLKWIILALLILLAVSIFTNGFEISNSEIGKNEAREKTSNFLKLILEENKNVKINYVNEESGLYKLIIELDGQSFNSYLSKDGKLFFPSSLEIDKVILNKNDISLNNSKNI